MGKTASRPEGEKSARSPAFFVVGDPKSGTGWLATLLDSHPEVLCVNRGVLFGRRLRRENLKPGDSPTPPASLQNAVLGDEYLRLWAERSGWTAAGDPDKNLSEIVRVAIDHFMGKELTRAGKRLAGDKTPFFSEDVLGDMAAIYPDARVIHIIRDGRDVAVSTMHQLWKNHARGRPVDLSPKEVDTREAFYRDPTAFVASSEGIFRGARLRDVARAWKSRVRRAVEAGPTLFGDGYAEVRYEDLLLEPEREAARLFRFLGADPSGSTVARCVEAASFEKGSGRSRGEENYSLRHGKYRKGIAGDWKNVFTERDKADFKGEAADLLVDLGYETDDGW